MLTAQKHWTACRKVHTTTVHASVALPHEGVLPEHDTLRIDVAAMQTLSISALLAAAQRMLRPCLCVSQCCTGAQVCQQPDGCRRSDDRAVCW